MGKIHLYISLILLFCSPIIYGQQTIYGRVIDSQTQESLPFVNVYLTQTQSGAITNFNGQFTIQSKYATDSITFKYVGYHSLSIALPTNPNDSLLIELVSSTQLDEVVVSSKKKNPAFRILKEINEHRNENDPDKLNAYEYEVYNKIEFDLTNLPPDFHESAAFRSFNFIGDYMDTMNGQNYLPVLLTESVTDYYYKRNPIQRKEVVKASRVTGVENLQLGQFTGDMYQRVNVYDSYISLFNKDFLSPIAPSGRAFYLYTYHGRDTIDNTVCYRISYEPRRRGDACFSGQMWIADTTYAVRRIEAEIPNHVNLNYVSYFKVEQDFERVDSSHFMVAKETVFAEFKLFNEMKKQKLMGVRVQKYTSRKEYVIDEPYDYDFYVAEVDMEDSAKTRSNEYWEANRHDTLNKSEAGVITMIDSLKENKTFRFYDQMAYLGYTGFWRAGYVEIGNLYSIYNKNVIEGDRLTLSLRTSNKFSKIHEISTFGIYGFGDKRFKYGAAYRWKIKNSPREMLRLSYSKKIEQLGLSSKLGDVGNSFTTLLSMTPLDKLTMVDNTSISFEKDYGFDMRTLSAIEWKNFVPLGNSDYSQVNSDGDTTLVSQLTSFEIRNQITYTREEKFVSANFDRYSMGSKYPIISLTHTLGIKGVLGSEYTFNRLDLEINHRPKIGFLGRLNYTIYGGKIFGTLPYPFLNIHQGNETYYLQTDAFNLLNYYEFISDEWVGVRFEHHFQGFILDKVPLIRKLKWRLLYTGQAVAGQFNNKHLSEMILPTYSKSLSYTKPYIEVGVGIENIFKFIRIDGIWRLTYLDNPEAVNFGIKFTFTGDF